MAVHPDELPERKSRAEYVARLESDPAHRYEFLDGSIYMMKGEAPITQL